MNKDLMMRFILGGAAVAMSYLITVISPWKILGGIFATFPAVMITAVLMGGITAGTVSAAKIANGSVFGMIGGAFCALTVWLMLSVTKHWILSIVVGLIVWLLSSILVAWIKEKMSAKMNSQKDRAKQRGVV